MINKIGNQRIYIKGNDPKLKMKLAAAKLLFEDDIQIRVEHDFEAQEGPVFGNCLVAHIGHKFFSYQADGAFWPGGIIATATFYLTEKY